MWGSKVVIMWIPGVNDCLWIQGTGLSAIPFQSYLKTYNINLFFHFTFITRFTIPLSNQNIIGSWTGFTAALNDQNSWNGHPNSIKRHPQVSCPFLHLPAYKSNTSPPQCCAFLIIYPSISPKYACTLSTYMYTFHSPLNLSLLGHFILPCRHALTNFLLSFTE